MKNACSAFLILFLSTTLLAACNPIGNAQKRERMTQLKSVTNTYRKLMRWGHFDQAAQYLKARDDTDLTPDLENMGRYKVTRYNVADELVADTRSDARVTAYVEFYNADTGVTTSVRNEQYWWFDDDGKRWRLGSPMVDFSALEK